MAPKEDERKAGEKSWWRSGEDWFEDRIVSIWSNLLANNLWQRMLKNTLATTITIILAFVPGIVSIYGKAIYLAPITTVFGHPGRRLGTMVEALTLAVLGAAVGTAWSMLAIYLSSLVHEANAPAGYTIKGVFLAIALLFHGFLRSHTPRLFIFVLLLIIVSVVSLTGTSTAVSGTLVTTLMYPILTAVGILLLVNLLLFPEFSSSFLGITTIETLLDANAALGDAGKYFTANFREEISLADRIGQASPSKQKDEASPGIRPNLIVRIWRRVFPRHTTLTVDKVLLSDLTGTKSRLRAKLMACKAAQTECNFELAFAVLPPKDLKPVSDGAMNKLVANTIALIGACESRYALMGDINDADGDAQLESQLRNDADMANVAIPSKDSSQQFSTHRDDDGGTEQKWRAQKRSISRRRGLWDELLGHASGEDSNDDIDDKHRKKSKVRQERKSLVEQELHNLELVKPRKEIEFGNADLLMYLVARISAPLQVLQSKIDETVNAVVSCLAYTYGVRKLPSGAKPPAGITISELDIRIEHLAQAIRDFDRDSSLALEEAARLRDVQGNEHDVMPRMETFLVSSFLLNLRQAALHTADMLKHSRGLVDKYHRRNARRRLYFPKIKWRKWLTSGGEHDQFSLPEQGRKDARSGKTLDEDEDMSSITSNDSLKTASSDECNSASARNIATGTYSPMPQKQARTQRPLSYRMRHGTADFVEYMVQSEDVLYALKLTIAVFLVTWPSFIADWNYWYYINRGLWASLQLVLVTEVAIGSSVWVFVQRLAGTSLGCLWGWAAFSARDGNPYVTTVMLVLGILPSTYVQLGSKYIKAGMVSIISMCVVALSTEVQTVPGTATENFLKRFIAFLIGGVVALLVEVVILPVRARDRLVESLASSIKQIIEMEAGLAYGVEGEINVDPATPEVSQRFDIAKGKAQGALTAAETFLPFCAQEPRLKGSFEHLALVYSEMLYVLHQIVDKMDNMLQIRKAYGSSVLEELNPQVYAYRRNVAGSITLILFSVHEALTTKLPLPQFLPSARLAHLRLVNRVREVVSTSNAIHTKSDGTADESRPASRQSVSGETVKRMLEQKFLSWNAASAGQIEVIEYLEELIDLTKLLVGANEFRSGMLTRLTYREYVERIGSQYEQDQSDSRKDSRRDSNAQREREEMLDMVHDTMQGTVRLGLTKRRAAGKTADTATSDNPLHKMSSTGSGQEKREDLPISLQRVRSRRLEQSRSSEGQSWSSGAVMRRVKWER